MSRTVEVTELALRDGHQSLLATRMALEDMLPVDCVAGSRVRLLLDAPAQPGEHVEGRVLRRADELELDGAFRVRTIHGPVHRSPPRLFQEPLPTRPLPETERGSRRSCSPLRFGEGAGGRGC